MKSILIKRHVLLLFTFCFCASALAADYDPLMPAEPAMLDDSRRSLQNRLQFPDVSENLFVLVLCNAVISRDGDFDEWVYCYRDEEIEDSLNPGRQRASRDITVGPEVQVTEVTGNAFDWYEERFEREVVEAARISRIQPARLYGKRVQVKMNFSVLFEKDGEDETIEVFLHHFRNASLYGTEYTAAQRFYEQKRFWEQAEPLDCPTTYVPVWMQSIVMLNGTAYNIKVEEQTLENEVNEDSIDRCITAYKKKIRETLHVPTMVDGSYVNGSFVELFYEDPREENKEVDNITHDFVVTRFRGSDCINSRGKEVFDERWRGAESALCREVSRTEDRYDDYYSGDPEDVD